MPLIQTYVLQGYTDLWFVSNIFYLHRGILVKKFQSVIINSLYRCIKQIKSQLEYLFPREITEFIDFISYFALWRNFSLIATVLHISKKFYSN